MPPADRPRAGTPDVSVIVPVYNTLPHLRRCLRSLVEQSIGPDRLEVIAVDDGSTDGSGRELDRFARRHPEHQVSVLHQPNSGGPAGPCNAGLARARGRYLFFVGADDYLGTEALERLVAAADRYHSDVVLGKLVGVNSRYVNQEIFARTATDVDLFSSPLPFALGNTKLFRRELVDRFGLRYPEDLPVGSDQPFTLEACYRASRITVLADYDYYYAVRRLNERNISYLRRPDERLRCVEALVDFAAGLIGPGRRRDAVLARHFTYEIAELVGDDLLRSGRPAQERLHAGVRRLVGQYFTDDIADRVDIETRIRLLVAQHGSLDHLLAVIRQDATTGVPPTVVDGDRWYAGYPGFRDPAASLPDRCFEVTGRADWVAKLDATAIAWRPGAGGRLRLAITARSPLPDLATAAGAGLTLRAAEVTSTVAAGEPDGGGTAVRTELAVDQLLAGAPATGQRTGLLIQAGTAETAGTAPLRAPALRRIAPRVRRRGWRPYAVAAVRDPSGKLMITMVPVTAGRVVSQLRRRWRRGGQSQQ